VEEVFGAAQVGAALMNLGTQIGVFWMLTHSPEAAAWLPL
jgi:hypothetical protein